MASRKLTEAQAALRDAGLDESGDSSGGSSGLLGGASTAASPAALATAPPAADGFDSAFASGIFLSLDPFLPYVRAHSSHISPFNSFFFAPADDSFGSFGGGGADEGFGAFGSSGNGDATGHAATGHAADDAFGDFDAAFAQPPQASAFVQPPAAADIGFGSFAAQGI